MDYVIRPLTSADEPLLWEMVHHGLQKGEAEAPLPPVLERRPELARYVEGWGRDGDSGFAAHDSAKGHPLGAVWARQQLPELAFAVRPGARRRGIGAALLTQWVKANPGQSSVSLAVSAGSPAVRLYERFGFRIVDEAPGSVTMRREI